MDRHARAGRATDLNEIKKDLHRYLPTIILANNKIIPALTDQQLETDRNMGFNSDCIGRLIVNINERSVFDADPEGQVQHSTSFLEAQHLTLRHPCIDTATWPLLS